MAQELGLPKPDNAIPHDCNLFYDSETLDLPDVVGWRIIRRRVRILDGLRRRLGLVCTDPDRWQCSMWPAPTACCCLVDSGVSRGWEVVGVRAKVCWSCGRRHAGGGRVDTGGPVWVEAGAWRDPRWERLVTAAHEASTEESMVRAYQRAAAAATKVAEATPHGPTRPAEAADGPLRPEARGQEVGVKVAAGPGVGPPRLKGKGQGARAAAT
jgi:hypothetical protein